MGSRPSGNLRDIVDHVTTTTAKQVAGTEPNTTMGGAVPPIAEHLRRPETIEEIRQALDPYPVSVDRFIRVCISALEQKPKLLLVHPALVMDAFLRCAQLGLEPNTALGHVFIEPVQQREDEGGRWVVDWILGYKGMVQLIYRSPAIDDLSVTAVHAADEWEYEQGTDAYLMHKQALAERGDIVFFYVLLWFAGAPKPRFEIVTLEEIDERRNLSSAVQRGDETSAWFTNELSMQRKTCLRIIFPMLPVSPEAADAVAQDGLTIDTTGAIVDPQPSVQDPGTEPQPEVEGL